MCADFHYDPPTEPWLTILHQDRDLVVIDKPSGLLSVPGRVHRDSALSRIEDKITHAYAVHRLDMDTSGLLIVATRRSAERALKQQFRERLIDKRYVAVVWGLVADDSGEIDLPLRRVPGQPPVSVVDHAVGRQALTRFSVVARAKDRTMLRLSPMTGRSHQLRVHLAALGHPIVGDRFYGGSTPSESRLHLHATRIGFSHPYSGAPLCIESTAPFGVYPDRE
jgi:tRNA pseudouridine32 synthase/23S rRNA pseudouridine746 synthase